MRKLTIIKLNILMALNLIWMGSNMYLIFNCALSEQYLGVLYYFIIYFFSLCTLCYIEAKIRTFKNNRGGDEK